MAALEAAARYRWVILGLALGGQIGAAGVSQSLGPLAPLFQPELGLSKTEVGLFASAAYAGAWSMLLVSGFLTDRFGVRKMMALGQLLPGLFLLGVMATGSALQAFLVVLAAGAARAPVFPATTKAIMEWFSATTRATAMGLKQTGAPVAGIIGGSTLPALGLLLGWRVALAVAGLTIFASGVAAALLYRNPVRMGRTQPRSSGARGGLKDVFRRRVLWVLGGLAFLLAVTQQAMVVHLALYFNDVVLVPLLPDAPTRIVAAGGFLAVCQSGSVFGRISWGVASDRLFGGRRIAVIALIGALGALMMVVMALIQPGYPMWLLTIIVFLSGASAGGWPGMYHTLVAESAGRRYAATALGLCLTLLEAGTTVGPPLFGFVVDQAGSYRTAWLMLAGLSMSGTAVAVLAARGEKRPS